MGSFNYLPTKIYMKIGKKTNAMDYNNSKQYYQNLGETKMERSLRITKDLLTSTWEVLLLNGTIYLQFLQKQNQVYNQF